MDATPPVFFIGPIHATLVAAPHLRCRYCKKRLRGRRTLYCDNRCRGYYLASLPKERGPNGQYQKKGRK